MCARDCLSLLPPYPKTNKNMNTVQVQVGYDGRIPRQCPLLPVLQPTDNFTAFCKSNKPLAVAGAQLSSWNLLCRGGHFLFLFFVAPDRFCSLSEPGVYAPVFCAFPSLPLVVYVFPLSPGVCAYSLSRGLCSDVEAMPFSFSLGTDLFLYRTLFREGMWAKFPLFLFLLFL